METNRQNDVLYLDMVYLDNITNEQMPFSLQFCFNLYDNGSESECYGPKTEHW